MWINRLSGIEITDTQYITLSTDMKGFYMRKEVNDYKIADNKGYNLNIKFTPTGEEMKEIGFPGKWKEGTEVTLSVYGLIEPPKKLDTK